MEMMNGKRKQEANAYTSFSSLAFSNFQIIVLAWVYQEQWLIIFYRRGVIHKHLHNFA